MTGLKHKKIAIYLLTLLTALAFALGCPGFAAFGATGNELSTTESVTVSSSLFSSTRYLSISAHEDGLSLRVNEALSDVEYATTTYTSELFMKDFFVKFKINGDNFSKLELRFNYDYEQDDANWQLTPKKQVQKLLLEKGTDGKISAKWQDGDAVSVATDFVGAEITVAFAGNKVKVNETEVGTAQAFPENKAQLEFRFAGVGEIEWDTDKQEASIYLTEMGYTSPYKIGEEFENVSQTFKSESKVADTSRPIARLDMDKMPTYTDENGNTEADAPYYAPLFGTVTVPVSGMDIVRSSITTTIKVKYAESLPAENDWTEADDLDSLSITNNTFNPDEKGYYAVTEIKVSDGRNDVTLTAGDEIDGLELPLVYRAFEDTWAPELTGYSQSAGKVGETVTKINGSMLDGGSVTRLQLPYPKIGKPGDTGVQLVEKIGEEGGVSYYANNAKALRYTLYSAGDSATFTENSGLTFTASSTTTDYLFYIRVEDLKGRQQNHEAAKSDPFRIRFRDKDDTIMITVTGFPHERYLDQSVSLPSGSVVESLGSTSAKIQLFLNKDKDGNARYNYEWQYQKNSAGEFRKDADGNHILVLDRNGYRVPEVYTAEDATENPAHPEGQPIYVDAEGKRIDYTLENGSYVMKDEDKVPEVIELSGTSFTPKYLGTYQARYNATDSEGNEAAEVVRNFVVVRATNSVTASGTTSGSGFHMNTLSIVFLSIAGACAIAIVVLLFVKPKDKDEEADKKASK